MKRSAVKFQEGKPPITETRQANIPSASVTPAGKWYEKAAKQGDADARHYLKLLRTKKKRKAAW